MRIIYRISDSGYNKVKPKYINNESCLANATKIFKNAHWSILADNISSDTNDMIQKYHPRSEISYLEIGHGGGTFNIALNEALSYDDDEIIYFLEDDYLHRPNSDVVLEDIFNNYQIDFVSLYDHPDKYEIDDPELTKVYSTNYCHWKLVTSTTMTFAAKVKTLKENEKILRRHTKGSHPHDALMFEELNDNRKLLVTPIPGYSTHGETRYLTPHINWKKIANEYGS